MNSFCTPERASDILTAIQDRVAGTGLLLRHPIWREACRVPRRGSGRYRVTALPGPSREGEIGAGDCLADHPGPVPGHVPAIPANHVAHVRVSST